MFSGVAPDMLALLPVIRQDALKTMQCLRDRTDVDLCCICREEYAGNEDPDDVLTCMPCCRTVFHLNCVQSWLKCSLTCPKCRAPPFGQ